MATKRSTLFLHSRFTIDQVDPRIFGGFLEHLGRAVYEGIYEPTSPHADESGCRKDVLAALDRLRFTAMRYPGGNYVSGFHWQDAVGPREKRPTILELAWQSLETNQFGPNEFLELSERMSWTPMLAVNLGTGTPEEARNWLEYCNVERGSKYADLRREHGYEKPFDVRLWCLGNEMDGPWQIGQVPAENYAINARQTARMMRMCDPKSEFVVCGSSGPFMSTYLDWDRTLLEYCKDDVEYLSVHRYVGNPKGDTESYLGVSNAIDQQIEDTDALCRAVYRASKGKKRIFLSFDEWNVWYRANSGEHVDGRGKVAPPLLEEVYNLEDALVAASFLNSFIRHADCVKIANLAQIVNVIAPILTRGDHMILQSIYYPFEMMSKRRNGVSLQVQVECETYEADEYGTVKTLDSSAILNGNQVNVFLVNRNLADSMEVTVDVADRALSSLVSGEILHGSDPTLANSFEKPDVLSSRVFNDVVLRDGKAFVNLPPLAVAALTFKLS